MSRSPRSWSRALAAALTSLIALSALVILRPLPAQAGEKHRTTKSTRSESRTPYGYSYSSTTTRDGDDGDAEIDAWVFSRDNGHWRNVSGSTEDINEAEDLRHELGDKPLFWFRRDGERYLITDPDLLRQIAAKFAPQEELGKRQGELGRRQGELGRLQGELGGKQGELGRMQARLSARQALLSTQVSTLSLRGRETSPLERELAEVSRQQDELGDLQNELGRQQNELGERQGALGERQSALGREQSRVAKQVNQDLGELTRKAIADGRAQRVER